MPIPWTSRTWDFRIPLELHDVVVERVRGGPARLEDKLRGLPAEWLRRTGGERWSIQEHAGHLLDLDELHDGRLDDYLAGAQVLRAADTTNRRTWEAGHNRRPAEDLLAEFRMRRGRLVERLDHWSENDWGRVAVHPRLQQPMRVIDLALFVAEHDDHHLAIMTERIRELAGHPD